MCMEAAALSQSCVSLKKKSMVSKVLKIGNASETLFYHINCSTVYLSFKFQIKKKMKTSVSVSLDHIIISLLVSFHINFNSWSFTGGWVTATFLRSPGLFWVF